MVNGKITMTGAGRELLDNPEIRAAYLELSAKVEQMPGQPL